MRVLLLGDGVTATTGFARVLRACAREFKARGWAMDQIAALDTGPRHDSEAYRRLGVEPLFPNPHDFTGRTLLPAALESDPDVVFLNSDPGTATNWLRELERVGSSIPTVLYAPIEGSPIYGDYIEAFERATVAYTYTRWASERLQAEASLTVPWVWHGVDDSFHPLTEGRRAEIRRELGWTDRFVVAYVARNAGRKAHDRLIKALAELRAHGDTETLLYLHCVPFDRFQLGGWNLEQVRAYCGLTANDVQFSPQKDASQGIAQASLNDRLGAADLYVHVAKVEGFGLPILEAMACGLPIVIPKDGGNMEEIAGSVPIARIQPSDYDTWFNGAQLGNLAPEHIALTIAAVRNLPRKNLLSAASKGLERVALFSWETMATTLADAVESVLTPRLQSVAV